MKEIVIGLQNSPHAGDQFNPADLKAVGGFANGAVDWKSRVPKSYFGTRKTLVEMVVETTRSKLAGERSGRIVAQQQL